MSANSLSDLNSQLSALEGTDFNHKLVEIYIFQIRLCAQLEHLKWLLLRMLESNTNVSDHERLVIKKICLAADRFVAQLKGKISKFAQDNNLDVENFMSALDALKAYERAKLDVVRYKAEIQSKSGVMEYISDQDLKYELPYIRSSLNILYEAIKSIDSSALPYSSFDEFEQKYNLNSMSDFVIREKVADACNELNNICRTLIDIGTNGKARIKLYDNNMISAFKKGQSLVDAICDALSEANIADLYEVAHYCNFYVKKRDGDSIAGLVIGPNNPFITIVQAMAKFTGLDESKTSDTEAVKQNKEVNNVFIRRAIEVADEINTRFYNDDKLDIEFMSAEAPVNAAMLDSYLAKYIPPIKVIDFKIAKYILDYIANNRIDLNEYSISVLLNASPDFDIRHKLRVVYKKIPFTPAYEYEKFLRRVKDLVPSDVARISISGASWNTFMDSISQLKETNPTFVVTKNQKQVTIAENGNTNSATIHLIEAPRPNKMPKNTGAQYKIGDQIQAQLPSEWFSVSTNLFNKRPAVSAEYRQVIIKIMNAMAEGAQSNTITISGLKGHRTMAIELANIALENGYNVEFNKKDGTYNTVHGLRGNLLASNNTRLKKPGVK